MTLAYVFWHRARPEVNSTGYANGLNTFHQRLADVPIPGFIDSWSLRVPELPWLTGGGYEDWYLVDDFTALGRLAEHAVDQARRSAHDVMARAVRDGAGGVYSSAAGSVGVRSGWCGWFTKRDGVGYPQLRADLDELMDEQVDARSSVVWQRQLVLGPAPEFRVLAPDPVAVRGLDLMIGVPVAVSG
jgi:hypothetical protein